MGCDIHLTMERRVWLLDAASLAALSLLRMLHLRTASEQLEVVSFDEQTAVLRVLQSPELLECIARSVSLVCADCRSNLGSTVISRSADPAFASCCTDEQAGWAKVSYLHQIFSPASIAAKMRTAFAATAEEHFEAIERQFFEEQTDLGDDGDAIMDRWVCGQNADAARDDAFSAAAHATQAMLDPSSVYASEIVVGMEAVITGSGMPTTDNHVQCTVVEWLEGPFSESWGRWSVLLREPGCTRLVMTSSLKSANVPRWDDMLPTLDARNYQKFALFSRGAVGAGHPLLPQGWAPAFAAVEGVPRTDTSTVPLECMIEGVPDDPHPPLLLGGSEDDDHYTTALRRDQHSPCHVYLDQLFATDWDVASGYRGEMTTHDGRPIRTRRDHLWQQFYVPPGATTLDGPQSNLVDELESFKVAIDAAPGVAASDFRLVMVFDN